MQAPSLRALLLLVTGAGLAVTAILNANRYWHLASNTALVLAMGIAGVYVFAHGRRAPFAFGFALFAALAYWVGPTLTAGLFMSQGALSAVVLGGLTHDCFAIVLGFAGGIIGAYITAHASGSGGPPRSALWVPLIALLIVMLAIVAAIVVKMERERVARSIPPSPWRQLGRQP